MNKTFVLVSLAAVTAMYDHCAELGKGPAFEVAAVTACKPGTPAPPGEHAGMVKFTYPGGRFEAQATTVKFLMEWAFGILPAQHSEGPAWMGDERWDIVAKAAGGNATEAQMKEMAQRLLVERFHLNARIEKREVPLLVVTAGKSAPKLTPAKEGEEHTLRVMPQMGADGKTMNYRVVGTKFTFAELNETFARQLDRVLVDRTGMQGDFDFALDFTPDETSPNPLDATHVLNVMRDQLGLTLKSEKGEAEYLVIESVERATGN